MPAPPKSHRRSTVARSVLGMNAVAPHSRRTAAGTWSTSEECQHDPDGRADCGKRSGYRIAVAPRQIDVK